MEFQRASGRLRAPGRRLSAGRASLFSLQRRSKRSCSLMARFFPSSPSLPCASKRHAVPAGGNGNEKERGALPSTEKRKPRLARGPEAEFLRLAPCTGQWCKMGQKQLNCLTLLCFFRPQEIAYRQGAQSLAFARLCRPKQRHAISRRHRASSRSTAPFHGQDIRFAAYQPLGHAHRLFSLTGRPMDLRTFRSFPVVRPVNATAARNAVPATSTASANGLRLPRYRCTR